jgi:hypothetical protein
MTLNQIATRTPCFAACRIRLSVYIWRCAPLGKSAVNQSAVAAHFLSFPHSLMLFSADTYQMSLHLRINKFLVGLRKRLYSYQ